MSMVLCTLVLSNKLKEISIFMIIIIIIRTIYRTGGSYPGSFQRRRFNNEDFTVTLPEGTDACDIGTITVWCQPFRAIFTRLEVPTSTFVSSI